MTFSELEHKDLTLSLSRALNTIIQRDSEIRELKERLEGKQIVTLPYKDTHQNVTLVEEVDTNLFNLIKNSKLTLDKDIIFLDIESTGKDVKNSRIITLSAYKILKDSKDVVVKEWLLNPQVSISYEVAQIHGITDSHVASIKDTFQSKANEILDFMSDSDLAGYNALKFDFQLLYNEFKRANVKWDYINCHRFIDVLKIEQQLRNMTLSSVYYAYTNKKLENAHNASADVEATIEIFLKQLDLIDDEVSIERMSLMSNFMRPMTDFSGKLSYDDNGDLMFNVGKFANKSVEKVYTELEPGYIDWFINKSGMPDDSITLLVSEIESLEKKLVK